jgi:putative oxidoreductase
MMSDHPTSIYSVGSSGLGSTAPSDTLPTRRPLVWNGGTDIGLLLLRFAVGGTFFAHGMQKVFGMWGGPGVAGFARNLEGFGYEQATTLSWVGGITELVAGAFVVLGVVTPLAAAALLAIKINAVLVKMGSGFFIASAAGANAVELDVVLGLAAAALVFTGPGRVALDNGRPWHRRPLSWGVLSLVVGVAAAVLVYVLLRTPAPPPP